MVGSICSLANGITCLRLAGAAALLLLRPFTAPFYGVYTLCGLSDMLDGTVARAMGSASEFGARLDSLADLLFCAAALLRNVPALWRRLPVHLWFAAGVVLLLRMAAYGVGAARFRRFAALHTYMNKLTGAMVFIIPYLAMRPAGTPFCVAACAVAGIAAAEELLLNLCASSYRPDIRGIWELGCMR